MPSFDTVFAVIDSEGRPCLIVEPPGPLPVSESSAMTKSICVGVLPNYEEFNRICTSFLALFFLLVFLQESQNTYFKDVLSLK